MNLRCRSLPFVAAAVVTVTLGFGAGPASSTTASPTLDVSPTIVKRGASFTVTGSHWRREAPVRLLIGRPHSGATYVATVRTTSRGTFRRKLTPPAWVQARTGRWVLLACRRDCRIKAVKNFRIVR
jgi:hypothetical protein